MCAARLCMLITKTSAIRQARLIWYKTRKTFESMIDRWGVIQYAAYSLNPIKKSIVLTAMCIRDQLVIIAIHNV